MSDEVLSDIKALSGELLKLDRINSIDNILNVPLLNSPRVEIGKLATDIRTLETPGVDREMARREFLESPIYKSLLLSADGKTTIIRVNFKRDQKYFDLLYTRNDLREKIYKAGFTPEDQALFSKAQKEFRDYHANYLDKEDKVIRGVREIMDHHRNNAEMFLGGLPMITTDTVSYTHLTLPTNREV